MNIIITNDDGYQAKGLKILTKIISQMGDVTVVAPKRPQSGMSMAVSLGFKPIAVKHLADVEEAGDWWYLDGTPASCVKFAIDNVLVNQKVDLVVSGINHGSNAATGSIYSGTLGAAMEGAVNGIFSIGVSLDSFDKDADFSAFEVWLPKIIDRLLSISTKHFGSFLNINFPAIPACEIKGVKFCHMGKVHWIDEYQDFYDYLSKCSRTPTDEDKAYIAAMQSDEELYVMAGTAKDNGDNSEGADHLYLQEGYITITPHNIDNTDYEELTKLCATI